MFAFNIASSFYLENIVKSRDVNQFKVKLEEIR